MLVRATLSGACAALLLMSGAHAQDVKIAHRREDYLLKSLRDFKAGTRTGGGVAAMAHVVYPLADDQLQALAQFMGHLH